ncbi:hypothetical protein L1987_51313 [Smallanthus sonchifolius]|uniref:Uncharacterized protein n=1 Tax=Smallanthus sonchifolius TaxID=185202 RepID=A0ACB9EQD2_9ASTR|nr:hypothetical protein L1987_51313 [Smallanthus sonchifolius]
MRNMREAPYNKSVYWSKLYIFWADEHVVTKNHVDSNYKLAKDHLLSKWVIHTWEGMSELPLTDTDNVIKENLSPEYGATMGFFSVYHVTLKIYFK